MPAAIVQWFALMPTMLWNRRSIALSLGGIGAADIVQKIQKNTRMLLVK